MKKITTILFLLIMATGVVTSQNERSIEELLEVLSQNHMGSVTDVFTLEEIQIIKNHFSESTFPSNNETVLVNKRYSSTESVATPFQAVDIDPNDLANVQNLGNSSIPAFPGAGIHIRGTSNPPSSPRIIVIDNNGQVYERTPYGEPITFTDLGGLTGVPAGHSITGIEKADDAIFCVSTNGANNTLLVRINLEELTVTPVGGNNGLILPIALARDGDNNIYTADIDDDKFYQLDKITGAATLVGDLGYDANFGQGMFYDESSGQIMNLAYNSVIGDSEIRTINYMTGLSVSLGTIQPGTVQQFGWGSYYDRDDLSTLDSQIVGFSFYPNPATNKITIEATNKIEYVELFSMLGQVVLKQNIDAASTQIDLSKLQSGNYILKVYSNNAESINKLIKL